MKMSGKAIWSQPTLQKLALKDAEASSSTPGADGTTGYS